MTREEKLEEAKRLYQTANADQRYVLESLFPELRESEDERIRKAIINTIEDCSPILSPEVQKRMIAWLEKQGEQKSIFDFNANNWCVSKVDGKIHNIYNSGVEPKFHKDEWVVNNATLNLCHILRVEHGQYICDDCSFPITKENDYHLWSIADAKPGDVLCWNDSNCVALFKNIYDKESFNSYGFVGHCTNAFESRLSYHDIEGAHPATKEQRELLFQRMKEAGYIFDFEKKELKKVEDENYDGEDYGIDSLFHAQRILEKTLGKVEGYQSDDGLLSHKCAISAVKKLYEQKLAEWSEEDEEELEIAIETLHEAGQHSSANWLKSLKQRLGGEE